MIGITGLLYNSADKLHTRGYVSPVSVRFLVGWFVKKQPNGFPGDLDGGWVFDIE